MFNSKISANFNKSMVNTKNVKFKDTITTITSPDSNFLPGEIEFMVGKLEKIPESKVTVEEKGKEIELYDDDFFYRTEPLSKDAKVKLVIPGHEQKEKNIPRKAAVIACQENNLNFFC